MLTNYYVMRACSPTRAALQTGRYTIRYGFQSGVLEPAKPYGTQSWLTLGCLTSTYRLHPHPPTAMERSAKLLEDRVIPTDINLRFPQA